MPQNMTPEEIQARLDEYNQALADGTPITEELRDSIKDASVGIKGYSSQLRASKSALTASMGGLVKSMVDGESGAAVYNDAIKSGAKVVSTYASKIPIIGGATSKVIDALSEVATRATVLADQQYKLFQDLSRSGLATGMNDAFKNLQAAGYTMKEIGEYGALMKENSAVLANMGGTAQEGLTKFAKISKDINNSGLNTQFMRMGMSIPDINSGIANYVKFQQMGGAAIQQDTKEVVKGAAEFMVEQNKLTKLTGLSAEEQNKIHQSNLATEQGAAKEYELQQEAIKYKGTERGEEAKRKLAFNQQMLAMAKAKGGPDAEKAAQMFIAGAVNTEGYQKFQRSFPELADMIQQGGTDIGQATNLLVKGASQTAEQSGALARGGAFNKSFVAMNEISKIQSNSATNFVDSVNSAASQIQKQASGADKTTANTVGVLQNQRDTTQSAEKVIDLAVGTVTKGLELFSGAVEQVSGVLGQVAGKKGRIGGGTTLAEKVGFASGGYTGDGGKYEPAGIVHKGEYVIDAGTTQALGLNRSISSGPGYAEGGLVGNPKKDPGIAKLEAKFESYSKSLGKVFGSKNNNANPENADGGVVGNPKKDPGIAKLEAAMAAYTKSLDQSVKKIFGVKNTSVELTDSLTGITEDQKESTQGLASTLNTSVTPVIKSFTLLTKTTDRLSELLESGTGEGKADDTVGLIDKTKTLVLSTIDKIKQTLGFSPTASAPSSGGSSGGAPAGGSPAGGAPAGAQPPKDTSPTEQVPSGSPPSAAEAKSAATPASGSGGGTGKEEGVKPDVLAKKAAIESVLGKKLTVTSGFRAGAANHGTGDAIDLGFGANQLSESERSKLYVKALDLGFNGIGAEYRAPGGAHIHLDTSHSGLMAWGSDYKWPPTGDSPFLTQLITDRRAGKTDTPMPSAAMGGVLSGPTSGYQALLHGNEAVVPLPDGRTIPVQSKGGSAGSDSSAAEQVSLLTQELDKLDSLLNIMTKQNDITNRMLMKQG